MRNKLHLLLLVLFISNDLVFGKNGNKTKLLKAINNKHETNNKENKTRLKRSANDDIENLFLSRKDFPENEHNLQERGRIIKLRPIVEKEPPFWGTRGRRDSSSDETVPDVQLPTYSHHKSSGKMKNLQKLLLGFDDKHRRDEADSPFWGNRGRRNSDESDENDIDLFWANRGRRQDEDPFWGTRGRREEDSPFWGNRGRRDDDEPFWGNRGRRQEPEPFWGTRGRRETIEPFWGTRGKKKIKNRYINKDSIEPFWGNRAKLKEKFKDSIIEALENVQDNISNLAKFKRNDLQSPFWMNRGRDSKLKYLFNGATRERLSSMPSITSKTTSNEGRSKIYEPNTVHDDRIYAEEPRYILVERNSRSSLEDDPFFISRGKKYSALDFVKDARSRRGALEEIVKSVRNDPYYIARGKKDSNSMKVGNSSSLLDQLLKTKDLVCSTIDLTSMKYEGNKVKREATDNERDRRTILKKLALQLQMDPYFVSRGKKSIESDSRSDLEQFINNIKDLCN
ncbi:uncharacterized protein LOC125071455 [Vanessa atalanta]|uniref:uncharacterized protein LOC125071455 n=1 Tax=Vanessa atalanta TaxID=42275 RepID=UPI001FCD27CE|nr:uncharacterized protein LOC125071455 [Vanessa atalanta]